MTDNASRGADSAVVKTVAKVLDILEHLGAAPRPLAVSEIAGSTQINVSTAHRLLQTLIRRGYAEQNPGTRTYALGPRLLELGSAYVGHHDLIGEALPRLEELRDTVGETIYLAIFNDGDNVEICTAGGHQAVSAGFRAGHREPANCTATGKVLLAFLPEKERDRFFERERLTGRTANSITDKAALFEELAQIRERRYALDTEELAHGLCCVAVPVRGPSARVSAAISIAMPKARFKPESVAGWVLLLNETAARISGALDLSGGR
jgi:IclR family KDG regulon transcriptional repressor